MEQITRILSDLYRFYPIGFNQMADSYEGYQEISKIVAKKINEIIAEEETPWVRFINSAKGLFPENFFLDMAYLQFPVYVLEVSLNEETNNFGSFRETLVLSVSLLTRFYTIYIREYFYKPAVDTTGATFTIVSSHKIAQDLELKLKVETLKKELERQFKGYEFCNHFHLFSLKASQSQSWPNFNERVEEGCSLHELLFRGSHLSPAVGVLP